MTNEDTVCDTITTLLKIPGVLHTVLASVDPNVEVPQVDRFPTLHGIAFQICFKQVDDQNKLTHIRRQAALKEMINRDANK